MIRFLKVVKSIDQVTDCIPVISTVKNGGILLYQLVHKVHTAANPVNTSWKDDIKIHVLSKDSFMAKLSMVPIVGNIAALLLYVQYAIFNRRGMFTMGYLAEASRQWNSSTQKHGREICALYLARNPDRSEKSLGKALGFACSANSPEVFAMILDSRNDWTSDSIANALSRVKRVEDAKRILNSYKKCLNDEQIKQIVECQLASLYQRDVDLLKLILDEFPGVKVPFIGRLLAELAGRKDVDSLFELLLERFVFEQKHLHAALKKAAGDGTRKQVELLLDKESGSNAGIALVGAASRGNIELFEWLLVHYKEKINTAAVGKALSATVQKRYYGENDKKLIILNKICSEYKSMPAVDLKMALELASEHNHKLFTMFLDCFSEIKDETVKDIYSSAARCSEIVSSASRSQEYKQVVISIEKKFPSIKASGE